MSYNLYIWDGPRPRDQQHLSELWAEWSALLEKDPSPPPTPPINAFTKRLDERWGATEALKDINFNHFPFSVLPVSGQGSGPVVEIPIQWEYAEAAASEVAAIARSMGLVCIDANNEPGDPISVAVDRALSALGKMSGEKPWWARVIRRG